MAIGEEMGSSNSYQGNKAFEPTYYSRFRLRNGNDQININFRSGLMILDMGSIGEGFKFTSVATIYLSIMKAHLLVESMNNFMEYMKDLKKVDPLKAFGVNTGMGDKVSFIGFSGDKEGNIYVTIGKFDSSGVITESAKYQFAKDYNYALEWDDIESNSIVKVFDNNAEFLMLRNAIADFSRNMVGSAAYAAADLTRYDANRMNKRIDQIFDKLGIERVNYNSGNRSYGENNFLNNSSSKSTTLEDIAEDLID